MTRKETPLKILFAGGGTGGHLFPGLAIADAFLRKKACDVRFVGTKRGIEYRVIPEKGFRLYTIPISGLYRVGLKKTIQTLFKIPFALCQSVWILLTFRPDLVVGIGGYASGPILAISILLGKRTIIQEQNAYPGLTNRLLGKWVPLSYVPFKGLEGVFKNPVVVGNPIRQSILTASNSPNQRQKNEFTLTILGGSQGARILNKTITSILPQLAVLKENLRIAHHTGQHDLEWVQKAYQKVPSLTARVGGFFDNIEDIYLKSNLIVCRAGSIVNEIVAMGRASILVPIASSSGNHQLENAKRMREADAAILIEEKDLTAQGLLAVIQDLITSPEKIEAMERGAKSLFPGDSAEKIADITIAHFNL